MSLHTFTRDSIPLSSIPASAPVVFLGHGGGSTFWNRSHPLAQWGLAHAPVVHSLNLPFHGADAVKQLPLPFDTEEHKQQLVAQTLRQVESLILPLLQGKFVIFLAYSTSGIYLLKLFRSLREQGQIHPGSILLCIGTALAIGSTQPFIQRFWMPRAFEAEPARAKAMRRMHTTLTTGEDDASWRNCVETVGYATGHASSGLFSTHEERRWMFAQPPLTAAERKNLGSDASAASGAHNIFFIQGTLDEPFPPTECILVPLLSSVGSSRDLQSERLRLLEGGSHFSYFAKGKGLEKMMQHIEEIVAKYGEETILKPWRAGAAASASASSSAAAPSTPSSPKSIVIIGAGVFGLCSAASLASRFPSARITILEKSSTFPSSAAASNDASRIVRPDYGSDALYTRWGLQAIQKWKEFNKREGEEVYKECGVLFLTRPESMQLPPEGSTKPAAYEAASFRTLQSPPFNLPLLPIHSPAIRREHFPFWAECALKGGYFQPAGGHVHAKRATELYLRRLTQTHRNVSLRTGVEVAELLYSSLARRVCVGVRTTAAETISADMVVVAAGCWTPMLLPDLATALCASAQPVVYVRPHNQVACENPTLATRAAAASAAAPSIFSAAPSQSIPASQLSIPSAAAPSSFSALRSTPFPVFSFDLSSLGFYGFPVDSTSGLVKLGHHGPGLLSHSGPDAFRRTLNASQLAEFAVFVRKHLPHLWQHGEVAEARTCFYADSFDGHWIVGAQPGVEGVFVASGGSGHAFKFLPMLAEVIAPLLLGEAEAAPFADRFKWRVPLQGAKKVWDVCRSAVVSGAQAEAEAELRTLVAAALSAKDPPRFLTSMAAYLRDTKQPGLEQLGQVAASKL